MVDGVFFWNAFSFLEVIFSNSLEHLVFDVFFDYFLCEHKKKVEMECGIFM